MLAMLHSYKRNIAFLCFLVSFCEAFAPGVIGQSSSLSAKPLIDENACTRREVLISIFLTGFVLSPMAANALDMDTFAKSQVGGGGGLTWSI